MKRAAGAAAAFMMAACSPVDVVQPGFRDTAVTISSKAAFQPARYAGQWFEIASYPTPFQRGCTRTVATYTPKTPSGFHVVNSCTIQGKTRQIEGFAEPDGPGRLRVSFENVPFVKAPYWVLWVDPSYQTAVIGTPSGRGGWILSRTRTIRADKLAAAREVLDFNGYDLTQLRMTPQ